MKPAIHKIGTIDCDLVETTPIVFRGRLCRFEYVRIGYAGNKTGESHFRFVDHANGDVSAPFAHGYHLGNVFVERDVLCVTGTNIWDGERVDLFVSADMESWEARSALHLHTGDSSLEAEVVLLSSDVDAPIRTGRRHRHVAVPQLTQ